MNYIKRHSRSWYLVLAAATMFVALQDVQAADVNWTNLAGDSWNNPANWSSNPALPGTGDVAVFGPNPTAAATITLDAAQSVSGLRITNPGGVITINTGTGTNTLTLDTGGIDLSNSTVDATINVNLNAGANQTWTVNGGRTLTVFVTNASRGLTGSGNISLQQAGTGVADFLMQPGQTGSVGFDDPNGNSSFTGNWTIGPNATARMIRNGRTAWGTGTITLAGGTVASRDGNWTWTTPIVMQTATSSTIDNRNTSGSNRYLKLQGALSGDGNLTFANTGVGFTSADRGFILTGANTLSGTVTINANTPVRVGGVPGDNTSVDAGTGGTLGTAAISNNGTLTLSRSDAWTFANIVSGSGALRIGGGVTGAGTQVVTVTGANSYSGGTTVASGRLLVNNTTGSGTGGGTVSVTGGTLGGTGTINSGVNPVNVAATASLTPGDGVTAGTLNVVSGSAVTLAASSTFGIVVTNGSTPSGTNGGSTIGTVPNPTSNNFLNVTGTGAVLNIDPAALIAIDGSTATFTLGSPYSYQVGAAPNDLSGLMINNQASFIPVGFAATNFSLFGDPSGRVFLNFTPVPEPTLVLASAALGAGFFGLTLRLKRRGRRDGDDVTRSNLPS